MAKRVPAVSIGVPVYNGEATIRSSLDALLAQSFADFEIVISDNASTDATASICAEYAGRDERIRYIRQQENIGAVSNFKFVFDQAQAPYFMWSAVDDRRSPDFLEENIRFLDAHPLYVASASPNCFEGQVQDANSLVTFAIEGAIEDRFNAFFDNCWVSHGIFYSVIRTETLRKCNFLGQSFLGADWAVDLYLASCGGIHRTKKALMISGAFGISNGAAAWRSFRTHPIHWVLPFFRVSVYAWKLSSSFRPMQRAALLKRLMRLNMHAAYSQLLSEIYPLYCAHIRPWRKRLTKG